MITVHFLKSIYFTEAEANGIMQRLHKLKVPRHKTKVRFNYARSGNICDVEISVNGHKFEDSIIALNSYVSTHKDAKVKSRWNAVLKRLIDYKEGIVL